jgi:hypothetical protein
VILERETSAGARGRNLKLIHNFLPKLVVGDTMEAAPKQHCNEELAYVELSASNLWDLKVFNPLLNSLILYELFLELFTFAFLIFSVKELKILG